VAFIYAVSDIHGYLQSLDEALSLIDLDSDHNNKLVFCGDYIDYGPESCSTLYRIKELSEKYPNQVITLVGNHEYMFLEFLGAKNIDITNAFVVGGNYDFWLSEEDSVYDSYQPLRGKNGDIEWLGNDKDFVTVNSFISVSSKEKLTQLRVKNNYKEYLFRASQVIKEDILTNHSALIEWLKRQPLYYETEQQIYVHAGLDEEAEEYWKIGTPDEYFLCKYPATFGKFHKDIIAGHISTSSLSGDPGFHSVFWDGENHFYIDGETNVSGFLPVLKYDKLTSEYTSFNRKVLENGEIRWEEYLIR